MNKIVVYGPGCAKCTALADVTKQTMQELHLEVPLEKVTDAMQFAMAGVLVTPALAVDGKVLVSGRVPSMDEIRKILQEAVQKDSSSQKSRCSEVQAPAPSPENICSPEDKACCNDGGCCGCATPKGGAGWKKAVVWVVLLLILLAVVKAINHQEGDGSKEPSSKAVPIKSGIEAVYYEYGMRCPTCVRMEIWARDAVEKNFSSQLKEGKLAFHTIPADMEAVGKYGLTTKSLLLKEWKDGKETRWMNLDRIWALSDNEQEFKEYVIQNIRKELEVNKVH